MNEQESLIEKMKLELNEKNEKSKNLLATSKLLDTNLNGLKLNYENVLHELKQNTLKINELLCENDSLKIKNGNLTNLLENYKKEITTKTEYIESLKYNIQNNELDFNDLNFK